MGFSDRLKELGDKAKDVATERKDQINQAVETAGTVADRRTGGRYRDKIYQATQKTEAYVEKVTSENDGEPGPEHPASPSSGPAASSEPQGSPVEPASPPPAGE